MTYPALPDLRGQSYPGNRTPVWSNLEQRAVSGRVGDFQQWVIPIWQYDLSYSVLRSTDANADFQTLVGFYNTVKANNNIFTYTDPDDGSATAEIIGTGDGATTSFQLLRSFGGFVEPVYAPSGVPQIFKNGVHQLSGYTIAGGVVTFSVAPANGVVVTWTGTFDWLCRFREDAYAFSNFAYRFWELKQITFETRVP